MLAKTCSTLGHKPGISTILITLGHFQDRCMFDPPSVKCVGGEFAGSDGEAVEVGAGQAVEDDSYCEEDLEQ